jgi:hypothetical protein
MPAVSEPSTPEPSTSGQPIPRSSGLAGVASALLFLAAVSTSKLPGGSDTPDDVTRYFDTRSHQVTMLVSGYLLAAAGLTFAWFLVGLLQRFRAGQSWSASTAVTNTAGIATTTLLVLGGGVFVAVPAPLLFETGASPGTATVAAGTVGLGVVVISMLAAGVTIVAASAVGRRTGTLPVWNVRLGYVCGVVLVVASVLWFTMILLAVWLIATGITLSRARLEPVERSAGFRTAATTT